MCTNQVTKKNIRVGNGATISDNLWTSSYCKENTLASAGECISEITFYRDDISNIGIVGLSYKTSKGREGTVGQYATTYTAAQYAYAYSKVKYTLPRATNSKHVTCLTGIDVTMLTTSNSYNAYFWNVGVKYNKQIPKYQSTGSANCNYRTSSGGGGGAAGGGSVGGLCCLVCCGAGIWYFFIKGKENNGGTNAGTDLETVVEEQPEQTVTTTVVMQQPQPMMMQQPGMMVQQPGMMMQQPGMVAQPGMMQPGMMA